MAERNSLVREKENRYSAAMNTCQRASRRPRVRRDDVGLVAASLLGHVSQRPSDHRRIDFVYTSGDATGGVLDAVRLRVETVVWLVRVRARRILEAMAYAPLAPLF